MIKAIIIDDESKARDLLELLLVELERGIEVRAKCPDLPAGIAAIREHEPDVVFLDIEMPEVSGLQLLDYIPAPNFELIFATAYDRYAIKAFELAALDYLLKPIDEDKLALSIDKLGKRMNLKARLLAYEQNRQQQDPVKICIPNHQGEYTIVWIQDIVAIQADRNYSIIYTTTKKYTLSKSLGHFADQYLPIQGFLRTHRSWIVHLKYIQKFSKKDKTIHCLDFIIPISRSNFSHVKEVLARY